MTSRNTPTAPIDRGRAAADERLAKGLEDQWLKLNAEIFLSAPGVYSPWSAGYMQRMIEAARERGLVQP